MFIRNKHKNIMACVLGIGDCGSKSTNTIKIVNDTINENITNIMNKTQNSTTANCAVTQFMGVEIGPDAVLCSPLNISQTSAVVCKSIGTFATSGQNNLSTIAQQAIEQAATASNDTTQSFLSTSVSTSTNNMDMKSYIKNLVQRNFTTETQNACLLNATISQNLPIKFNGKMKCATDGSQASDWVQDAQLSGLASCTAQNIQAILLNDTTVQSAVQKSDALNKTTQKGVSEIIDSIFGGLSTMYVIIVIGIIILLLGSLYFLL